MAGVDGLQQPLGVEGGGERELDLVEVSSTETISVIHLRETRSSTISTAIPARVKCVVSKIQIEFVVYSTQSGKGRRFDLLGRGRDRSACLKGKHPPHRRRRDPHPA